MKKTENEIKHMMESSDDNSDAGTTTKVVIFYV